jgi:hypothetical protein
MPGQPPPARDEPPEPGLRSAHPHPAELNPEPHSAADAQSHYLTAEILCLHPSGRCPALNGGPPEHVIFNLLIHYAKTLTATPDMIWGTDWTSDRIAPMVAGVPSPARVMASPEVVS